MEEGASLLNPDHILRNSELSVEDSGADQHGENTLPYDAPQEEEEEEVELLIGGILSANQRITIGGGGCALIAIVMCFSVHGILGFIATACVFTQLVGFYMSKWVLGLGQGNRSMKEVGNAIREGSEAYVKTMFGTIFCLLVPTAALVFTFYLMQASWAQSLMITLTFLLGATCSSMAGIIGMWSSTRANARVAHTACAASFRDTIVVALRAGSICGITVVSMAVFSISCVFSLCYIFVEPDITKVADLLIGYGFGASFVAMFAQLGGGIFTKAADVGADLCGKLELDIPEDDPRNPAVIADLVGDNVGDCCARGADLFESLSAEIIASMILAGSLARDCTAIYGKAEFGYILFPLMVHVIDLIVSSIGVMSVRRTRQDDDSEREDPMSVLKSGYKVAVLLAAVCFFFACWGMLNVPAAPRAWIHFVGCGAVGMATGFAIVLITQYYTDFNYKPVQDIAAASEMGGHGTNVIQGLSVGFKSTMAPVLVVCFAIQVSYTLGMTSGLETTVRVAGSNPRQAAGLYGTAVATMGMLSNLTYVLAMDVFGPITDNAAGIVEMSPECPASARNTMDRLDATGNTTKAFTKGFAVGSAGLACFLLFRAFLDIIEKANNGMKIVVDIVAPEVFIGGLVGAATVFLFAGLAMEAVGQTAQKVVVEVRRQFHEVPGIATGERKPDYAACVAIVSSAALKKMLKPGALVVIMPILVGKVFQVVGSYSDDHYLGAKCMTSYLVVSSITAMLVALFLNNGGGAWDNAKKYIEAGNFGGKGSDAHKAAITGDTVGDPCKDTAGPSLHVLMKLTATVTMVVGPLVAMPHGAATEWEH